MNWKREKINNMKKANNSLLSENHETGDTGKIDYIKVALENLSPGDLDKVYKMVEDFDPKYGSNEKTNGNDFDRFH